MYRDTSSVLVVLTFASDMTKLLTLIAPNGIGHILRNWNIQIINFK